MTYIRDKVDKDGDAVDRRFYCGEWCYNESLDKTPPNKAIESQMAMAGGKPVPRMFLEAGGNWPGYESDYPVACDRCEEWVSVSLTPDGVDAVRAIYDEAFGADRDSLERAYPFLTD